MTRKAFTLIELLVVVAVLALLASIVFSNLGGAREGARISNALSFQSQTHSLLGSDLVGWWNFNEGDARDISGYNNHGTIVGATHVDGVPGTGGSALSFNGVGDYVDIGNNSVLAIADETITISVWAYMFGESSSAGLVVKGNAGGWAGNEYGIRSSGGALRCYVSADDSSSSQYVNYHPFQNEWFHLTMTVNDDEITVYENGYYYDSRIKTISTTDKGRILFIGQGYSSTFWKGLIDDVRIYNRALTASEIQTLYAQTKDNYLAND